ncbi:MAG: thioredoxin family protein [Cytophagales bacterium]|nr:thioredoxin family protein [Cytophagales bacterium]
MKRVIFGMIALLALGAGAPVGNGYEIGDTVADFKLKNFDDRMVSLSDYKNTKGFIVIFDCNTCPYSKAYNSRIIALHEKYGNQGFPVITINPNDPTISKGDSFEKMAANATSKGYKFPYLVDETQSVAKAFGATNTPHVFVLRKDGKGLKVAYIGAIDNSSSDQSAVSKRYVEEAVDALLGNGAVTVTKTKAIGCGIKWKNS